MKKPYIIELSKIGSIELGFITVAEESTSIPFRIARAYWTYNTPEDIERGHHAHKNLEQIIVAVSGELTLELENIYGELAKFVLDTPDKALYIPGYYWRKIGFSKNAVLLCLASEVYEEKDYIRDYEDFKKLKLNS